MIAELLRTIEQTDGQADMAWSARLIMLISSNNLTITYLPINLLCPFNLRVTGTNIGKIEEVVVWRDEKQSQKHWTCNLSRSVHCLVFIPFCHCSLSLETPIFSPAPNHFQSSWPHTLGPFPLPLRGICLFFARFSNYSPRLPDQTGLVLFWVEPNWSGVDCVIDTLFRFLACNWQIFSIVKPDKMVTTSLPTLSTVRANPTWSNLAEREKRLPFPESPILPRQSYSKYGLYLAISNEIYLLMSHRGIRN